jgi:hypothetical protein
MMHTSEKYKPLDDFSPRIFKPDLKSCFFWFLALVIFIGLVVGISIIFEK